MTLESSCRYTYGRMEVLFHFTIKKNLAAVFEKRITKVYFHVGAFCEFNTSAENSWHSNDAGVILLYQKPATYF